MTVSGASPLRSFLSQFKWDASLCAAGAVLGVWLDGFFRYISIQQFCSAAGSEDILTALRIHLLFLPNTSVIMLVTTGLCILGPGFSDKAPQRERSLSHCCGRIALMAGTYLAMILSMNFGHRIFAATFPVSPLLTVLGAWIGMLMLVAPLNFFRQLVSATRR